MYWETATKERARKLRGLGYTFSEIRKSLRQDIPKSTLSNWLNDVQLPSHYAQKLKKINERNRNKGRALARKTNAKIRQELILRLKAKNEQMVKSLDSRDKKIILAILYLTEGSKHPSTRHLRFASKDPEIIALFLDCLKSSFDIDQDKIRGEVLCRADQDGESLIHHWVKVTGIPRNLFYRPRVDRRTVGKPTRKKNYKGVCVIDYFDTKVQLEIQYMGEMMASGARSSAG